MTPDGGAAPRACLLPTGSEVGTGMSMRWPCLFLCAIFCAACSGGSGSSPTPVERDALVSIPSTPEPLTYVPGETQVLIPGRRFTPTLVEVTVGSKVVWGNTDVRLSHRPVADGASPLFRSYVLAHATAGGGLVSAFAFTFRRTGTFRYHCEIHPDMVGTITVT